MRAFHFKDEDRMNVVALPVDEEYVMLGHLVEREQGFEAVQVDGRSLGLFSSAGVGAAALIEAETQRHLPLRTAQ
jgi:hypothetical protein